MAAEVAKLAAKKEAYLVRVKQAENFAANTPDGKTWNSLYLMGLALAGLEMVPYTMGISPHVYWITAPSPHPDEPDAWPTSWVIEMNAFNEIES